MSFDWSDYLAVAERLVDQGRNSDLAEAYFRSAISRAYYAAYHKALEFLRSEYNFRPPATDSHYAVVSFFRRAGATPAEWRIGEELGRLRDVRVTADYRPSFRPQTPSIQAQSIVDRVRRFYAAFDALS